LVAPLCELRGELVGAVGELADSGFKLHCPVVNSIGLVAAELTPDVSCSIWLATPLNGPGGGGGS
jgi:hypothetical protein